LALVPNICEIHPNLFRILKTKPITQIHVSAADIKEATEWFKGFTSWCEEYEIKLENILNFDEAGFQVSVAPGEDIIIIIILFSVLFQSVTI
jgi:hypothetical protein